MDAISAEAQLFGDIKIPLRSWACPRCGGGLVPRSENVACADCGMQYPIINGVPILINDEASVFAREDFTNGVGNLIDWKHLAARRSSKNPLRIISRLVADAAPSISLAVGLLAKDALSQVLRERPDAVILILGCGARAYEAPPPARIVYTDASLSPLAEMVADAMSIPFKDETFDFVMLQAVIAYVSDPQRAASEVCRVLKPGGCVFDSAAFMQQVQRDHDFTRFTFTGHRRLWRHFDEIKRGIQCGPAMGLAWSILAFAESFAEGHAARSVVRVVSRYALFGLKYFDYFLVHKRGAYDAASSFYFFGRKRDRPLTDREIIASHIGLRPR